VGANFGATITFCYVSLEKSTSAVDAQFLLGNIPVFNLNEKRELARG
jgi:hypothetical protein